MSASGGMPLDHRGTARRHVARVSRLCHRAGCWRSRETAGSSVPRTLAPALQNMIGESTDHVPNPPQKKGSVYQTNWHNVIGNDAKYIGKAVAKVPSLGGIIGDHSYRCLVWKDAEIELGLFDIVTSLLPRVRPVVWRDMNNNHEDDDEHDAEKQHLNDYSTTAFPGNLDS
jgi:hypothetical protein